MYNKDFELHFIGGNISRYIPNFDENVYEVTRISGYNEITTTKETSDQVLESLLRSMNDGYFQGFKQN